MLHSKIDICGNSRENGMYGLEFKKKNQQQITNHPLAQGLQDPQSTDLCKNYLFSLTKEDASKEISCLCLRKVNCYNLQGVLVYLCLGTICK